MAVDYSQPSWQNPATGEGAVLADIIGRARNQRREESGQKFQQGLQTQKAQRQSEEFNMRKQAAAAQLLDMHGYQSDIASGMQPAQAALRHPLAFQSPKVIKPDVIERVPTGQMPGFPPTPDPTNPAAPGTGSATGVRNPNTGAITFPEPLNRRLSPPGQMTPYETAKLAQEDSHFKTLHPPESDDGPATATKDGHQYYKGAQGWHLLDELTSTQKAELDLLKKDYISSKTAAEKEQDPEEKNKLLHQSVDKMTKLDKWFKDHSASTASAKTPNTAPPVSPQATPAPATPSAFTMPKGFKILERNGKSVEDGESAPTTQPAALSVPKAHEKFSKSDFDEAMKDLTPRQHQVALNVFDDALAAKIGLTGEQIGASKFKTSPRSQLLAGLKAHPDARLEGLTDKDATQLYWLALQAGQESPK